MPANNERFATLRTEDLSEEQYAVPQGLVHALNQEINKLQIENNLLKKCLILTKENASLKTTKIVSILLGLHDSQFTEYFLGTLTSDSTNTSQQFTQKPGSPFRPINPSPRPHSPQTQLHPKPHSHSQPQPQPHEGDTYRMVSYLPPPLNYQDVSGINNTLASNEEGFTQHKTSLPFSSPEVHNNNTHRQSTTSSKPRQTVVTDLVSQPRDQQKKETQTNLGKSLFSAQHGANFIPTISHYYDDPSFMSHEEVIATHPVASRQPVYTESEKEQYTADVARDEFGGKSIVSQPVTRENMFDMSDSANESPAQGSKTYWEVVRQNSRGGNNERGVSNDARWVSNGLRGVSNGVRGVSNVSRQINEENVNQQFIESKWSVLRGNVSPTNTNDGFRISPTNKKNIERTPEIINSSLNEAIYQEAPVTNSVLRKRPRTPTPVFNEAIHHGQEESTTKYPTRDRPRTPTNLARQVIVDEQPPTIDDDRQENPRKKIWSNVQEKSMSKIRPIIAFKNNVKSPQFTPQTDHVLASEGSSARGKNKNESEKRWSDMRQKLPTHAQRDSTFESNRRAAASAGHFVDHSEGYGSQLQSNSVTTDTDQVISTPTGTFADQMTLNSKSPVRNHEEGYHLLGEPVATSTPKTKQSTQRKPKESTVESDSDVIWAATLTADKVAVKQDRKSAKPDNMSTTQDSISSNSKVSVLHRPIDQVIGLKPVLTEERKSKINKIKPSKRLIGEVAFQLDRRILEFIFSWKFFADKSKKRRYYGYSLANLGQMIRKEATDEEGKLNTKKELELRYRFDYVRKTLKSFGYNFDIHGQISQNMVNKYGLLNGPPDKQTIKDFGLEDPVVLRMLLNSLITDSAELENELILLDCLCLLAHEDRKSIFMW